MNARKFEVPLSLMVQFAEMMEDQKIDNTVQGVSIFGDIEILVSYTGEHNTILNKMSDMIDEYNQNRNDTFFKRIIKKAIKTSEQKDNLAKTH